MQAEPNICVATDRCKTRRRERVEPAKIAALEFVAACCLLLFVGRIMVALIGATPAIALDDRDFCVLAQQLAMAAEKDIGLWIDRQTRNAGMVVSCDRKTVQFTRFTYAPSASMNDAWKAGKAADWNAVHCNSPIWKDAIASGWKIVLSQTAADGGQATIMAQCGK